MFPPLLLDRSSVACEICFSSGKLFFIHSTMLFFPFFGYSRKCRAEIMQSEVNFPFLPDGYFLNILYTGLNFYPSHCRSIPWFQWKWFFKFLKCHLILNFFMLLCTFHGIKMKKKWSALLGIRNEKKKVKSCLLFIFVFGPDKGWRWKKNNVQCKNGFQHKEWHFQFFIATFVSFVEQLIYTKTFFLAWIEHQGRKSFPLFSCLLIDVEKPHPKQWQNKLLKLMDA